MPFPREAMIAVGVMTVSACVAFALTPEPGPPLGRAVANDQPHITNPDDRRKATEKRFGDFRSEVFKQGLLKARQKHLEQAHPNRK